MKKQWILKKRKAFFIVRIATGAFIFIGLTSYLIVHSYLSKINYQSKKCQQDMLELAKENTETAVLSADIFEEMGWDEKNTSVQEEDMPEASKEKIAELEEKLQMLAGEDDEIFSNKNVWNILLIGCDSRQQGENGRSDTNILVSVNRETKQVTLTSIMRDCFVAIPGHTSNRLNAAYAYGGADLLLETIEKNFGIPVEQYMAVDFYSFIEIVDAIGGVDLEITEDEIEVMNQYICNLNQLRKLPEETDQVEHGGVLHLNGTQVLAYARIRYVGNADFDRTKRQRIILTKIFEKAKRMSLLEINDMLNLLLPQVKTNMSEKEIFSFLLHSTEYLQYEVEMLRIPVDGSYEALRIRNMEVLGVDLEKNQKVLKKEIYGVSY